MYKRSEQVSLPFDWSVDDGCGDPWWGPLITDEEVSSVFEESSNLELLTPGVLIFNKYKLPFVSLNNIIT